MKIEIKQLIKGAKEAKGLTVIIDVFRAFTTACYMVDGGAEKIIPVGDIEYAYRLKEQNQKIILVGERNEQKPEGFTYGNSPIQIIEGNVVGKTIVHTTSSGTQGIVNATYASEIITGSFVNADAIVRYIRSVNPEEVSLCCMGYAGSTPTEEDTCCAEYIKASLLNESYDFEKAKQEIRKTAGSRFFIEANQHFAPEADFYLCLELHKFDFVLKVEKDNDGILFLNKISI